MNGNTATRKIVAAPGFARAGGDQVAVRQPPDQLAANLAKRLNIRSFGYLYEALGDMLQFPTDLSEGNGLKREGFGSQCAMR